MSARILVAGSGNVFLGDDGFGVEVARRLQEQTHDRDVVVSDFGIRAMSLAYDLLDPPDLLLFVDATNRGRAPGTLYLVRPANTDVAGCDLPSAHAMNIQSVLRALRGLGGTVPRVLLIGCEPDFIGERIGLSPPVEAAVPSAIAMVERVIEQERAPAWAERR